MKVQPTLFHALLLSLLVGSLLQGRTVVDVGADWPSGSDVDVTDRINEAIQAASPGTTLRFPEGAEFLINGTVAVHEKVDLIIDARGSLLRATDPVTDRPRLQIRNRAHVRVTASDGVELRNFRIHGAHPNAGASGDYDATREAQHGFDVIGRSRNVRIVNAVIHDVYGDGVYVGAGASGVIIEDSSIERTGRQGIAICNATDVLVQNNYVGDSRRGIFNLEAYDYGWVVDNVRILNNRTGRARLLWMPISGRGLVGTVIVAGNTMESTTGVPVVAHGHRQYERQEGRVRGPFLFFNNTILSGGSPAPMVRTLRVDGLVAAGNRIELPAVRRMTAFGQTDAQGTAVVGNEIIGADTILALSEGSFGFDTANEAISEVEWGESGEGYWASFTAEGIEYRLLFQQSGLHPAEEPLQFPESGVPFSTTALLSLVGVGAEGDISVFFQVGEGETTWGSQTLREVLVPGS